MTPPLLLLLALLLQHHHDEPIEVEGDGPAVLAGRTVSRFGPFGHVVLMNERLEVVAAAEVGRVTGWAVRRAEPARVAVLEVAGRGAGMLRLLDGRTLEPAARPVRIEDVARPRGPLGVRGAVQFVGEGGCVLAVLGDPLAAPGEDGAPTLWTHRFTADDLAPIAQPAGGFPAPPGGPFSLAAPSDRDLVAYVGRASVTCIDLPTGRGETFRLPLAEARIDAVAFPPGDPRLFVGRGAILDALDPRTGDWTRLETGPPVSDGLERRIDPATGRVAMWDPATGEFEIKEGTGGRRVLGESLKGLEWVGGERGGRGDAAGGKQE